MLHSQFYILESFWVQLQAEMAFAPSLVQFVEKFVWIAAPSRMKNIRYELSDVEWEMGLTGVPG